MSDGQKKSRGSGAEGASRIEEMLNEAIVEIVSSISTEDVASQIRSRLIDEFGFEPVRHVVVGSKVDWELDGLLHEKFDEVLHYVSNGVPVLMWAGAGSGKGVLGRQVAQALGLDYHFMSSVTDEFKINGFIDAYGNYHETPFYRAFKDGGLFFLDELDASAPEVLVCLNMALSDGVYSFPNGPVEAHRDFRVIAASNTLGTGADAVYTGRAQLDAASLNRFVAVKVDYDPAIDLLCARGDDELAEFAESYREAMRSIGLPSVCSYRNIGQIKVGESALPLPQVLSACLCKEMNQDDINITVEHMRRGGLGGNRYLRALSEVVAAVG